MINSKLQIFKIRCPGEGRQEHKWAFGDMAPASKRSWEKRSLIYRRRDLLSHFLFPLLQIVGPSRRGYTKARSSERTILSTHFWTWLRSLFESLDHW